MSSPTPPAQPRCAALPQMPAAATSGLVARHIDKQHQVKDDVGAAGQSATPEPEWTVRVEVYRDAVKVRRKLRQTDGTPRSHPGGGRRGPVRSFSPAAARRLRFLLENSRGLHHVLHLTYPNAFPNDGAAVKRHWKALREWLVRQGRGGVWTLEFQARRGPHFMVLLDGPLEIPRIAARWAAIVGSGDPGHLHSGTRVERVRSHPATHNYMVKNLADPQKQVPADYANVGKLWGAFGGVKAEPEQVVEGSRAELAPVVRSLRNLENSRRRSRGGPRLRDNGVAGWTARGLARPARHCLARLDLWETTGETERGLAGTVTAGASPFVVPAFIGEASLRQFRRRTRRAGVRPDAAGPLAWSDEPRTCRIWWIAAPQWGHRGWAGPTGMLVSAVRRLTAGTGLRPRWAPAAGRPPPGDARGHLPGTPAPKQLVAVVPLLRVPIDACGVKFHGSQGVVTDHFRGYTAGFHPGSRHLTPGDPAALETIYPTITHNQQLGRCGIRDRMW